MLEANSYIRSSYKLLLCPGLQNVTFAENGVGGRGGSPDYAPVFSVEFNPALLLPSPKEMDLLAIIADTDFSGLLKSAIDYLRSSPWRTKIKVTCEGLTEESNVAQVRWVFDDFTRRERIRRTYRVVP